jgi:NADH:ubiquinone oxidoreductase subunit 3 (subunit A)
VGDYVADLAALVLAGIGGVVFVAALYGAVKLLAPARPYPLKNQTYECGHDPLGEPWVPYRIQYYAFAIIFLIFDIETAFFYPIALVWRRLGVVAMVEILVFVAILLVGLLYAWRRGVLKWE